MTIAENITLSTDCGKKYRELGTSQIISWDKIVLRDATTAILSQKLRVTRSQEQESTYLRYQGNHHTANNRPKHTEHRVLVKKSSSDRHTGVSTLWIVQITFSSKQVNIHTYVFEIRSKMWSKERPITRPKTFQHSLLRTSNIRSQSAFKLIKRLLITFGKKNTDIKLIYCKITDATSVIRSLISRANQTCKMKVKHSGRRNRLWRHIRWRRQSWRKKITN